jgi:hypothetical protein
MEKVRAKDAAGRRRQEGLHKRCKKRGRNKIFKRKRNQTVREIREKRT